MGTLTLILSVLVSKYKNYIKIKKYLYRLIISLLWDIRVFYPYYTVCA